MRMDKLFAFFLFTASLVLSLCLQSNNLFAYPATEDTCDSTGCYLSVHNNLTGHSDAGSLQNAIDTACRNAGNDLISFSHISLDQRVIAITQPIIVPRVCNGSLEISGQRDLEIVIDATAMPRSATIPAEPATTGRSDLCAIYMNASNTTLHHITVKGAAFGLCLYGDNNQISDSNIGINRAGNPAANNVGVYVPGGNNIVLNNNIASNSSHGILLKGHNNLIQGNYIGTTSLDVNRRLGNGGSGIRLISGATQNIIGGNDIRNGNLIRYNAHDGIVLEASASTGNLISHNRFALNSGLAIDLGANGVSYPPAPGPGPNNMIGMPTAMQAIPMRTGDDWDTYLIRGNAPANYFIEIYLVDDGDNDDEGQKLSGQSYGEGDFLLTSQRIIPARDGRFSILVTSSLLGLDKRISAIVRDAAGNTSEFSAAIQLKNIPNPNNPNCGDAHRDAGETCDDGNITPGDGCSAICTVEPGYTCSGGDSTHPDHCMPQASLCGNGVVDPGEACDDGDRVEGNGCGGDCTVDPGYDCTHEIGMRSVCTPHSGPMAHCGNGRVEAGEDCDDASNPCCDMSNCHFASTATMCSDGRDDTSMDHCDGHGSCVGNPRTSTIPSPTHLQADATGPTNVRVTFTDNSDNETGFEIDRADGACSTSSVFGHLATVGPAAGTGSTVTYNDDTAQPNHTYCYRARAINPTGHSDYSNTDDATTPALNANCGNGRQDSGESCDDSNTNNGDGCSNSCQVESGWHCSGSPSSCTRNGPPTNLTARVTGPTEVTVQFTDNSDNETGFGIDRADGECRADSVYTQIATAPALPGVGGTVIVIDHTVEAGKTYCYRARALLPTGSSDPTNSASVTLPNGNQTPPPECPTNAACAGNPNPPSNGIEGSGCMLHKGDVAKDSQQSLLWILLMTSFFSILIFRKKLS